VKIVLLSPQSDRYGRDGVFGQALRYAPLTLSTLASLVPPELNAEICCIDEWCDSFDPHTIEADLVGITTITPNAPKVYRYSQILRNRGIVVVLGGPHITLLPSEAEQHASAIVVGYAEITWPRLLHDFVAHKLQKRYDLQPLSIDGFPRPRRDLLNEKAYTIMNVVQATRGCVYRCTFCVVPSAWPKQLARDPDDVAKEVSEMKGKTFVLIDLSPSSDELYFGRLCDAFAPLKKYWGGLATINITDNRTLMKKLERSGCKGLLVGIESRNPQTLKTMGKTWHKPDDYLERIKILHDHGIAVNGCFVFGMDGDDESVFDRTLEFVMKANIDLPRFAIATPFPGTPFYRMLEKQKRLYTRDWSFYSGQNVVFEPKDMTARQLYEGVQRIWKEAYKPTSIFRRVGGSLASWNPVLLATSVATNIAYNYYARMYPSFMPIPCEFAFEKGPQPFEIEREAI